MATNNVKATCNHIGIGRATFYRWLHTDQAFYARYQQALDLMFPEPEEMSDEDWEKSPDNPHNWSQANLIRALKRLWRKK